MIACVCCGIGEVGIIITAVAAGGGAWWWDKLTQKRNRKMDLKNPLFHRIHEPCAQSIGPHTPSDAPESPQNDSEESGGVETPETDD